MRRPTVFVVALVLAVAVPHAQVRWTGSTWVGEAVNLEVLPPDISRRDLVETMKSFSSALDVGCEHCHQGAGDDLSKFDFISDKAPAKRVARKMMAMVNDINKTLATVGEPAASGPRQVTCFTCHRGTTKPLRSPGPVVGRGRGSGPARSHVDPTPPRAPSVLGPLAHR